MWTDGGSGARRRETARHTRGVGLRWVSLQGPSEKTTPEAEAQQELAGRSGRDARGKAKGSEERREKAAPGAAGGQVEGCEGL